MQTRIIAVVSDKGGVGKTTAATSIAHGLALRGDQVLLVDFDLLGQDAIVLGLNPEPGVYRYFVLGAPAGEVVRETERPGLSLLPGDGWTRKSDDELRGRPLNALMGCLEALAQGYDYMVIDTHPSGYLQEVAIQVAEAVVARSQIGEPLGKLIETIAQEFRKVNIFALCSAQIWIAARSGGSSALRDSFASAYVHRMRRNQARLLLPTDEARQVETLGTGQAVLWRTSGEAQTIVIPNTTLHDVVQVAQRLRTAPGVDGAYPPAYFSTDGPASSLFDPGVAVSGNVSGEISGLMSDVKAVRALELFLEGKGQREILAEVWGVTGGPPYQQAARQFNEILRQQIRSGYGE